jgi:predicted metalloprotease with PDZ domain
MILPRLHRRALIAAAGASAFASPALAASWARYRVTLQSVSPPRFAVQAELPGATERLVMFDSWPAELAPMAERGWPALVRNLRVRDAQGPIVAAPAQMGWLLARTPQGPVTLNYGVDLSIFEGAGWSSPLESAVSEDGTLAVHARALFIASGADSPAQVRFVLPSGWRAATPWPASGPDSTASLQDNFLAFTYRAPVTARASGFTLELIPMGHWRALSPLLKDVAQRIIGFETRLMGWRRPERYLILLTPAIDQGGESYRQSLAFQNEAPSADNRGDWANTLAHEVFHYWNYGRLKGADYASTQWFQEGFTEYVANLTLLSAGVAPQRVFLDRLDGHFDNAAKLTTTLENIGTHKGPPLYSAGALVAFNWDCIIRRTPGRDIGDFFRNLMRVTGEGARPYGWAEIRAALEATAPHDWEGFYQRHIRGPEKLDPAMTLAAAGLAMREARVEVDPDARPQAHAIWRSMTPPDQPQSLAQMPGNPRILPPESRP